MIRGRHVHELHNPAAEKIEAPKDQTLIEVKPQGRDPASGH